jgi:TolA-binding protein
VSAPGPAPAPNVGPPPGGAALAPAPAPRPIAIDVPRARPKLALHAQPPRALPLPPLPAARPIPSPAELAFNQGWEALRAGSHAEAAAHMERALALGAGGALDEDARYLRAVALGRAGATRDARLAMEQFLRTHPRSARAGTVAAMLGWLLVDAQERELARAAFRTAEQDPNPKIRQSARAGLELLGE